MRVGGRLISHKFWDGVMLVFLLLLSSLLVAAVIELIMHGSIGAGIFSTLTKRILSIFFAITIVLMIIILVLENDNPIRTMAWILVLLYLPVVGFIFYLFFGRNWRKTRIFSRKELDDNVNLNDLFGRQDQYAADDCQIENPLAQKLIKLLECNSKAILTCNNHVQIIPDTEQSLNLICDGIQNAKEHIHLEYFAISDDSTGRIMRDLLIQKASEGVEIRFIYDDVGCWNLPRRFISLLRKAGVQMVPFMPALIPWINSRLNYRNHRKLIIIDGIKAYLGGLNIADKYLHKVDYFGYWRDTMILIEGEGVCSLQALFLTDWFFVTRRNLLKKDYFFHDPLPSGNKSRIPIQISASGPDSDHSSIMQAYFAAIANAQRSIDISTPYLILNESLLTALKTAALSGVEIRIIVPHKADHFIVFWGSKSYYEELMEVGIQIYEYMKGFMHAKVLIVDGRIASIGTANMDLRSFNHNFEMTAMIYNPATVSIAAGHFEQDIADSRQIIYSEFRHRPLIQKPVESVCRLFSPLL